MAYHPLSVDLVAGYLRSTPVWRRPLGESSDLEVSDLADGNVNLVYRVRAPAVGTSVIVKQALPYARSVGESFPMPLSRSRLEFRILQVERRLARAHVPRVYHYDGGMHVLVMEDLRHHRVLRGELLRQADLPALGRHMGRFLASTLFFTSDLAMDPGEKKRWVKRFLNPHLCRVTEDLVFTEPFVDHPHNHWNPLIDDVVVAIRRDRRLQAEIADLKWRFMSRAEALIHGDLHTGSIMVTADDTRVIDPEFGFYGPMGFDVGALLGNLALAYLAQPGHAPSAESAREYRAWIAETMCVIWQEFAERFTAYWQDAGGVWPDPFCALLLRRVFEDALGFAGVKMMRRIIGLAHVADLDTIADLTIRAGVERAALHLAREWVLGRREVDGMDQVLATLRQAGRAVTADAIGRG